MTKLIFCHIRIMVKIKFKIFLTIIFVILIVSFSFAGSLVEVDGFIMYKNDYGEIAKDTWVWIDTDNDSIAECFRFDKEGHLAIDYKDRYGRETNELGQLVEDGIVIKKMLSSGEVLNKKETPASGILEFLGNIINKKSKNEKDKWTGKEINVSETNGITGTIDNEVIYAKSNNYEYEEVDILNGETAENGVIYSNGKQTEISDGIKIDKEYIAGKDFRKFIVDKYKCDEKVDSVHVYGGDIWSDVLVLSGKGAYVKFELDKENYMRFEVVNEAHGLDSTDTDMTLDIYLDGKLYDNFDEFVDSEPKIYEEYLEDAKIIELKLNIKTGSIGRKVYIRNGRFKKVKIK